MQEVRFSDIKEPWERKKLIRILMENDVMFMDSKDSKKKEAVVKVVNVSKNYPVSKNNSPFKNVQPRLLDYKLKESASSKEHVKKLREKEYKRPPGKMVVPDASRKNPFRKAKLHIQKELPSDHYVYEKEPKGKAREGGDDFLDLEKDIIDLLYNHSVESRPDEEKEKQMEKNGGGSFGIRLNGLGDIGKESSAFTSGPETEKQTRRQSMLADLSKLQGALVTNKMSEDEREKIKKLIEEAERLIPGEEELQDYERDQNPSETGSYRDTDPPTMIEEIEEQEVPAEEVVTEKKGKERKITKHRSGSLLIHPSQEPVRATDKAKRKGSVFVEFNRFVHEKVKNIGKEKENKEAGSQEPQEDFSGVKRHSISSKEDQISSEMDVNGFQDETPSKMNTSEAIPEVEEEVYENQEEEAYHEETEPPKEESIPEETEKTDEEGENIKNSKRNNVIPTLSADPQKEMGSVAFYGGFQKIAKLLKGKNYKNYKKSLEAPPEPPEETKKEEEPPEPEQDPEPEQEQYPDEFQNGWKEEEDPPYDMKSREETPKNTDPDPYDEYKGDYDPYGDYRNDPEPLEDPETFGKDLSDPPLVEELAPEPEVIQEPETIPPPFEEKKSEENQPNRKIFRAKTTINSGYEKNKKKKKGSNFAQKLNENFQKILEKEVAPKNNNRNAEEVEKQYKHVINLLHDNLENLSSEELVEYYKFIVEKAKKLYLLYLKREVLAK